MNTPTEQRSLRELFQQLSLGGAIVLISAFLTSIGVAFEAGRYCCNYWTRPVYVLDYHCDSGLVLTVKSNHSNRLILNGATGSGSEGVPDTTMGNLHYGVRGSRTELDCVVSLMKLRPNKIGRSVYEEKALKGGDDQDGKDLTWP